MCVCVCACVCVCVTVCVCLKNEGEEMLVYIMHVFFIAGTCS